MSPIGARLEEEIKILLGIVCILIASPLFLMFLVRWMGWNREWLNLRSWGFPPFGYLALANFMFAVPITQVIEWLGAQIGGGVGQTVAGSFDDVGLFLVLGVCPLLLVGSLVAPLPRFLLPRWMRDRFAVGDRLHDPDPSPEHLEMMIQRGFDVSMYIAPTPEQLKASMPALPFTVRVRTWRWWATGVVLVGAIVGCAWVLWGVVSGSFGDLGGFTRSTWWMTPFIVVLGIPAAVWFFCGAIRSNPLTVSGEGLSTPMWELAWGQVRDVRITGGRIELLVDREVADRYRHANRWHSGRPGGAGGLEAKGGETVSCQAGLRDQERVAALIAVMIDERSSGGSGSSGV